MKKIDDSVIESHINGSEVTIQFSENKSDIRKIIRDILTFSFEKRIESELFEKEGYTKN